MGRIRSSRFCLQVRVKEWPPKGLETRENNCENTKTRNLGSTHDPKYLLFVKINVKIKEDKFPSTYNKQKLLAAL